MSRIFIARDAKNGTSSVGAKSDKERALVIGTYPVDVAPTELLHSFLDGAAIKMLLLRSIYLAARHKFHGRAGARPYRSCYRASKLMVPFVVLASK